MKSPQFFIYDRLLYITFFNWLSKNSETCVFSYIDIFKTNSCLLNKKKATQNFDFVKFLLHCPIHLEVYWIHFIGCKKLVHSFHKNHRITMRNINLFLKIHVFKVKGVKFFFQVLVMQNIPQNSNKVIAGNVWNQFPQIYHLLHLSKSENKNNSNNIKKCRST